MASRLLDSVKIAGLWPSVCSPVCSFGYSKDDVALARHPERLPPVAGSFEISAGFLPIRERPHFPCSAVMGPKAPACNPVEHNVPAKARALRRPCHCTFRAPAAPRARRTPGARIRTQSVARRSPDVLAMAACTPDRSASQKSSSVRPGARLNQRPLFYWRGRAADQALELRSTFRLLDKLADSRFTAHAQRHRPPGATHSRFHTFVSATALVSRRLPALPSKDN